MGKRQAKKGNPWSKLVTGMMISLALYLAGVLVYALLLVKGVLPNGKEGFVLGACLTLSVACGGIFAKKSKGGSPLTVCLLESGFFCILLLTISYIVWDGPSWGTGTVTMLLCVLLGGMLPMLIPNRKGRGKKNKW